MDKKLVEIFRARVKEAEAALVLIESKPARRAMETVIEERRVALGLVIEHSQARE